LGCEKLLQIVTQSAPATSGHRCTSPCPASHCSSRCLNTLRRKKTFRLRSKLIDGVFYIAKTSILQISNVHSCSVGLAAAAARAFLWTCGVQQLVPRSASAPPQMTTQSKRHGKLTELGSARTLRHGALANLLLHAITVSPIIITPHLQKSVPQTP
jgi:hypothetical protein